MGIHWTGIVFGLGFVISFAYWTTDFLVVQRVLAAKDLRAAKMAPIIGAAFKMFVPFIVILPGLLGLAVLPFKLTGEATAVATGGHSYNEVLPLMLARYCGPGLLGLGVTALIAGFMSGMAGNVSAFSTVWTYDIYAPLIKKKASDAHYVLMGRWSTVVGVVISIGTAYLVMQFLSIMDYVQALVQFLRGAAFRHRDPGHVVETRFASRRILGLACGHRFVHRNVGVGAFRSLGAALRRAIQRRARHGRKYVSRTLVVDHLRRRHRRGQPAHEAQAGK